MQLSIHNSRERINAIFPPNEHFTDVFLRKLGNLQRVLLPICENPGGVTKELLLEIFTRYIIVNRLVIPGTFDVKTDENMRDHFGYFTEETFKIYDLPDFVSEYWTEFEITVANEARFVNAEWRNVISGAYLLLAAAVRRPPSDG